MITETQNLVETSVLSLITLLCGRSGIVLVSPCNVPRDGHGSECHENNRCVCHALISIVMEVEWKHRDRD